MNKLIDFFDRYLLRITGTFALIITYEQMYFHQGWLVISMASLTFAVFLAMAWIPSQWWTHSSYVAATGFVLGVGFFLYFSQHVSVVALFWPLVALLGLMPQRLNTLSWLLAFIVVTSTVLLAYVHPFSLGMTLGLIGTYMGLRNRVIRRETNALRRQHLEELQAAHRELQHAHEQLQEATVQSIQYAALAERTRIARDVHDGLGHHLTSLIVQLQALEVMLPHDLDRAVQVVPNLLQIARAGMAEVRHAVSEWAADESELGSTALRGLLSQVEARSGIKTEFIQTGPTTDWSLPTSTTLYRILQEALTNALRHAEATHVTVRLEENDGAVMLEVADNGKLMRLEGITPGFGIAGMRSRCQAAGGQLELLANAPQGLRIRAVVPLDAS